MKKLLMGSVSLLLFSASLLIFQASCKKEANAQANTATTVQEGKLLVITSDSNIGIENYDGSGLVNLHIAFPAGYHLPGQANITISPDHKTIFFALTNVLTDNGTAGYACNIDGTNIRKVDNSNWHIAF